MKMLNLGCGRRKHSDWVNADIAPCDPSVIKCDLNQRFPFEDNHFDVVYHSHIIEHFRLSNVLPFMSECWRVLKPGGIIRVATPDLERICRLYLQKLSLLLEGQASAEPDYNWLLLEMYDQTVRERTSGMMLNFLAQEPLPNEEFVINRIGQEARGLIAELRAGASRQQASSQQQKLWPKPNPFKYPLRYWKWLKQRWITKELGSDWERMIEIGRFRTSGEVHHWMYDRFSMANLLRRSNFIDPVDRKPFESSIPGWSSYHLDTLTDQTVIKPDSLYMEASKPDIS